MSCAPSFLSHTITIQNKHLTHLRYLVIKLLIMHLRNGKIPTTYHKTSTSMNHLLQREQSVGEIICSNTVKPTLKWLVAGLA